MWSAPHCPQGQCLGLPPSTEGSREGGVRPLKAAAPRTLKAPPLRGGASCWHPGPPPASRCHGPRVGLAGQAPSSGRGCREGPAEPAGWEARLSLSLSHPQSWDLGLTWVSGVKAP